MKPTIMETLRLLSIVILQLVAIGALITLTVLAMRELYHLMPITAIPSTAAIIISFIAGTVVVGGILLLLKQRFGKEQQNGE